MYGLPQELDPDERFYYNSALSMIKNKTPDPGWYGHPGQPLIYLIALLVSLIAIIGTLLGQFSSYSEVVVAFARDVSLFHASGRVLIVGFTVACIWLTSRLIQSLGVAARWRGIALIILCLSPLWGSYASVVRSDMIQIFFMLASLQLSINAVQRVQPKRNLIFAGACVGVAVTSKYPGVLAALPIVVCAALLLKDGVWTKTEAALTLTRAGCASLILAVITGPFLFVNFVSVLHHLVFESRDTHLGFTGSGFTQQLTFYLSKMLPSALSGFAVVLAFVGLAFACVRSDAGKLLATLTLAYIVFISSLSLQWARWMLPVLPLLTVAFAVGAESLERIARDILRVRRSGLFLVGLCTIFFLPTVASRTIPEAVARMLNQNTQVQALSWAEQNIPGGSHVLTETYAPALTTDAYEVFVVASRGELGEWNRMSDRLRPSGFYGSIPGVWRDSVSAFEDALSDRNIDYILLSNTFYERYLADPKQGEIGLPFYDIIFDNYELIKTIEAGPWTLGPKIFILKRADQSPYEQE